MTFIFVYCSTDILTDTSHPLHTFYSVAKSGCRYLSERTRINRYCNIFLPNSIRLLNAKSWSGSDRGGEGKTMGKQALPLLLTLLCKKTLILCYADVYCTNFPFVTVKGYCILPVSYRIASHRIASHRIASHRIASYILGPEMQDWHPFIFTP